MTEDHVGWIGMMHQLTYTLRLMGGDRDADGRVHVTGSITTFMGQDGPDAEVVVGADAMYYIGGQPRSIARAMAITSYGRQIQVF